MTPEQVEREDPIREAVTAHWGERCPGDPDPSDKDCVICRVWVQLDRYEAQAARIRELGEALAFYADEATYETQYERLSCECCTDIYEPINDDKGAKARAVLHGEK